MNRAKFQHIFSIVKELIVKEDIGDVEVGKNIEKSDGVDYDIASAIDFMTNLYKLCLKIIFIDIHVTCETVKYLTTLFS